MKMLLPALWITLSFTPTGSLRVQDVPDIGKSRVELPLKLVLKRSGGLGPGELEELSPADGARPGDVRWHATYEAALAAAATSGKPVLLFQLLGRLDAGFC